MQRCYLLTGERLTGFDSTLELIAATPRDKRPDSYAVVFDRIRTDALRIEYVTHAHRTGAHALSGDRVRYILTEPEELAALDVPLVFKEPLAEAFSLLRSDYRTLIAEAKAEFDAYVERSTESARERRRTLVHRSLKSA